MNCAICKSPLNPGEGFCPQCGTKVISACPRCGQAIQPGQTFCSGCGSPLGAAPAAPFPHTPAAAAPPPPAPTAFPPALSGGPPPLRGRVEAQPAGGPPAKSKGLLWVAGAFGCLIFVALASAAAYYFLSEKGGGGSPFGNSGSDDKGSGKLDPDKAPVEFTRPSIQGISSGVLDVPIFKCTMKNVSTLNLMTVEAVAVFANDKGEPLPGTQEVAGAPVGQVEPGDEYEVTFTAENKEAVSAKIVLKEVMYEFVPEGKNMGMFKVPMTWKNKKFDQEVKAAQRPGK